MTDLEKEREEFKYWYKKEKIARTGVWSSDDEKALEQEIIKIEGQSALSAFIITGAVFALIISAMILIGKAVGAF